MAEQHGKALVPEIRFSGFTDPWEQRKLGEVATFGGGHTPSMSDSDNYEGGNVLWVTSQDVKSHYLDGTTTQITEKGAKELTLYPAGSLVMVTRSGILRRTLPVAELRKPSTVNQDIRVILPQGKYYGQWLLQFFISRNKELLLEFGKTGTTVESVDFSKMRDMVLLTPSLPEQQQIGHYFARLDNLITLHQRKYDKLCVLKKSMLDKMFPKGGSLYPEIRFAGFTDPWEQRKLGELASKRIEKNSNGIKETFTNSAEHGVVSQLDYFDHDITNDANIGNYSVVYPDDFVYNPRISTIAPCGPINRNKLGRNGVMSPLYTVFSVDDMISKLYLEHYFKTNRWHQFMFLEGNSGARSDRFSISDSIFFEMPIQCPVLEEQELIASFFDRLDSLITLHQRKLELLRNIKKSMLDKMFV